MSNQDKQMQRKLFWVTILGEILEHFWKGLFQDGVKLLMDIK